MVSPGASSASPPLVPVAVWGRGIGCGGVLSSWLLTEDKGTSSAHLVLSGSAYLHFPLHEPHMPPLPPLLPLYLLWVLPLRVRSSHSLPLSLVAPPVESNYAIMGGEGPPQEPQPIESFVASGQQEETINQGSWILISLPLVPYD